MTDSEYANRANRHRPADDVSVASEARRLERTGLSVEDISIILRITPERVAELLDGAA